MKRQLVRVQVTYEFEADVFFEKVQFEDGTSDEAFLMSNNEHLHEKVFRAASSDMVTDSHWEVEDPT